MIWSSAPNVQNLRPIKEKILAQKAFLAGDILGRIADIGNDKVPAVGELAMFLAGVAKRLRMVKGACGIHFGDGFDQSRRAAPGAFRAWGGLI